MIYVTADIHNDADRLNKLLAVLDLGEADCLYILGDLFDRCSANPDPVGVYFNVLGLGDRCKVLSGNHDRWLAEYIHYRLSERKRQRLEPYYYNSFDLLNGRLTEADMLSLSKWLLDLPLQIELTISEKKILLAHAMTSYPEIVRDDFYYMMGADNYDFFKEGLTGYTSIIGHFYRVNLSQYGEYLDETPSIWRNNCKNVYMIDSGCGFSSGRLACLCLDNMEHFYI